MQKQRIIELRKKRPDWFNPNLLQPTTKEEFDSEKEKKLESSLNFEKNIKNN